MTRWTDCRVGTFQYIEVVLQRNYLTIDLAVFILGWNSLFLFRYAPSWSLPSFLCFVGLVGFFLLVFSFPLCVRTSDFLWNPRPGWLIINRTFNRVLLERARLELDRLICDSTAFPINFAILFALFDWLSKDTKQNVRMQIIKAKRKSIVCFCTSIRSFHHFFDHFQSQRSFDAKRTMLCCFLVF